MAIIKCRECGEQISDQAKTCPKCGIERPGIKPASFWRKIGFGFMALMAVIIIGGNIAEQSPSTSPSVSKPSVELVNTKWWMDKEFVPIMLIDTDIRNSGTRDVKDVEITCEHQTKTGTKIDSNTRVVYEFVRAGKTLKLRNFDMGFIHSKVDSTSCAISDFKTV